MFFTGFGEPVDRVFSYNPMTSFESHSGMMQKFTNQFNIKSQKNRKIENFSVLLALAFKLHFSF